MSLRIKQRLAELVMLLGIIVLNFQMILGVVILLAGLAVWMKWAKCPHCGGWIGRNVDDNCKHCGKDVNGSGED